MCVFQFFAHLTEAFECNFGHTMMNFFFCSFVGNWSQPKWLKGNEDIDFGPKRLNHLGSKHTEATTHGKKRINVFSATVFSRLTDWRFITNERTYHIPLNIDPSKLKITFSAKIIQTFLVFGAFGYLMQKNKLQLRCYVAGEFLHCVSCFLLPCSNFIVSSTIRHLAVRDSGTFAMSQLFLKTSCHSVIIRRGRWLLNLFHYFYLVIGFQIFLNGETKYFGIKNIFGH